MVPCRDLEYHKWTMALETEHLEDRTFKSTSGNLGSSGDGFLLALASHAAHAAARSWRRHNHRPHRAALPYICM